MSIAVSNMVPITMPRFVSASSSDRAVEGSEVALTQNINQNPNRVTPPQRDFGESLDFDLLAEYLLDDVNLPAPPILETNLNTSHNITGGMPFTARYGNDNSAGLVSDGSTPTEEDHQYNPQQVALMAAATADPLADGSVQIKHGQTMISGSGDISTDLQHVQQLIVHQANANANANANVNINQNVAHDNRIQQMHMPSMDHKNYNAPNLHTNPVVKMTQNPGPAPIPQSFYAAPTAVSQNTSKRRRTEPKKNNKTNMQNLAPKNAANNFSMNIPMQRQKQKSQAQIDRRRERNRILARRTRLRKKFFFESLQKEVMDLQKENAALRNIVKTSIPDSNQAKTILDNCKKAELPPIVIEELGMSGGLDQQDFCLVKSLKTSQQSFIITDPSLQDNPIVYASDHFLTLTGYSRDAVLGRNCRFLQGTETDKSKVDQIRKGVAEGEDVSVCLVNYTADGTPFWNKLFIAALRDTQNNIVNFIGVTVKVSGPGPDDPESAKVLSGAKMEPNNSKEEGGVIEKENNSSPSDPNSNVDSVVTASEGVLNVGIATDDNVTDLSELPTFNDDSMII